LRIATTNQLIPSTIVHRSRTPGLLDLGEKAFALIRSTPERLTSKPPLTCWNCGKTGHTSSYCTEPKKAIVQEIDEEEQLSKELRIKEDLSNSKELRNEES
jgi:hypothetical protein